MFNFTTTHVLNDIKNCKVINTGKAAKKALRLAKGLDLNADGVQAVYVNGPTEGDYAEVNAQPIYNTSLVAGSVYRVKLELRPLDGADSTFANALVDKNKIIYLEATAETGDTGKTIIKKMMENAEKYMTFIYGESLIDSFEDGGADMPPSITFKKGVDVVSAEFQMLSCNDADCGMAAVTLPKSFQKVKDLSIIHATPEFGTYNWLIHNLRLPTGANTSWMNINTDEMPVPGAEYVQFTVHYMQNRGILGMNAVGQNVVSSTVHVFYVIMDCFENFLQLFTNAGVSEDRIIDPAITEQTITSGVAELTDDTVVEKLLVDDNAEKV